MAEFSDFEKNFISKIKDKRLKTSLTLIREAMENIWTEEVRIIKNFTDHGKKHCERISEYAWKLLEANKGNYLTDKEIYLLLAGIYLHDIGMQCDVIKFRKVKEKAVELGANFECTFDAKNSNDYTIKQQKEIRKNHNYLSAAWIHFAFSAEDNSTFNTAVKNIPDEFIKDLIDVCKFHSREPIEKCNSPFNIFFNDRKRLVAAILRLADELDVGKDRVNFETTKNFNLPPENALYWWLHSRTIMEINYNIISLNFRLHPDNQDYSSIIKEIYIDGFSKKNKLVFDVLKLYKIYIAIDAFSRVVLDIYAKKLPPEIISELERRSQTSFDEYKVRKNRVAQGKPFRVDFNYEGDPGAVGCHNYNKSEMTNRQIAENQSTPIALTFGKCPTCGHLSRSRESFRIGARCSKCNRKGVSSIFPGLSELELLRMVFYFYKNACIRKDALLNNLVSDIQEEVGKTLDHEEAIKLANDSRKMFDEFGDEEDCLEKIDNFLRSRLSLGPNAKVKKLFWKLYEYSSPKSHIFEEHRGVVIITCILLETLLRDLLTNILVKSGLKVPEAEDICDDIRYFDKRKKKFKKLTEIPLKDAMNKCSDSNFYDNWDEVRKRRNDFLHKGEYYWISPDTAEIAFNLAKNSFSVFANLHNRFCVKDINTCNDDEPNAL